MGLEIIITLAIALGLPGAAGITVAYSVWRERQPKRLPWEERRALAATKRTQKKQAKLKAIEDARKKVQAEIEAKREASRKEVQAIVDATRPKALLAAWDEEFKALAEPEPEPEEYVYVELANGVYKPKGLQHPWGQIPEEIELRKGARDYLNEDLRQTEAKLRIEMGKKDQDYYKIQYLKEDISDLQDEMRDLDYEVADIIKSFRVHTPGIPIGNCGCTKCNTKFGEFVEKTIADLERLH